MIEILSPGHFVLSFHMGLTSYFPGARQCTVCLTPHSLQRTTSRRACHIWRTVSYKQSFDILAIVAANTLRLFPLLLAPRGLYCFISLILHFTEMDKCIGNVSSTGLSFLPPPARTGVPESFYFHSCWKISPCFFHTNIPSFVTII